MQVRLKAGDGVVYSNLILHWPSDYSTKHRRTIHLGYRSFGGAIFPYSTHFYWDLGFTKHLSPASRARFERFAALHAQERDDIEAFFRAILDRDESAFQTELALLHPGEAERLVCVTLLSRLATKLHELTRPGDRSASPTTTGPRPSATSEPVSTCCKTWPTASRLRKRASCTAALRPWRPRQTRSWTCRTDYDVEDFIATWRNSD